jgi:hypothetical protein
MPVFIARQGELAMAVLALVPLFLSVRHNVVEHARILVRRVRAQFARVDPVPVARDRVCHAHNSEELLLLLGELKSPFRLVHMMRHIVAPGVDGNM